MTHRPGFGLVVFALAGACIIALMILHWIRVQ